MHASMHSSRPSSAPNGACTQCSSTVALKHWTQPSSPVRQQGPELRKPQISGCLTHVYVLLALDGEHSVDVHALESRG